MGIFINKNNIKTPKKLFTKFSKYFYLFTEIEKCSLPLNCYKTIIK